MAFKRFTVKGTQAPFPVDMLRHDEAWPETPADSNTIKTSFGFRHGRRSRWECRLISTAPSAPDVERWGEFSVEVKDVKHVEQGKPRRRSSGGGPKGRAPR